METYSPTQEVEDFLESISSNFSWIAQEIRAKISLGKQDEVEYRESRKRFRGYSTKEYSSSEQIEICVQTIKAYFVDLYKTEQYLENLVLEPSNRNIQHRPQNFTYGILNENGIAEPKLFRPDFLQSFSNLQQLLGH